jgi:hypothetical protein
MKKNRKLFVCIHNDGYVASLDVRKIYQGIPDADAERLGMIRIIDESGEDYLYPKACFAPISLPAAVRQELKLAA